MRAKGTGVRTALVIGVGSLVAGCVQPVYMPPGPIQLQPYPPPASYQSTPDYRPPLEPIPLQAPPVVQPLPPPDPSATDVLPDDSGPIPVQDMPAPASDATAPAPPPTPAAAEPEVIPKASASGPGRNVPLEGFRPMKGQTRPAP